jgi:excisionase family DNA binding protein
MDGPVPAARRHRPQPRRRLAWTMNDPAFVENPRATSSQTCGRLSDVRRLREFHIEPLTLEVTRPFAPDALGKGGRRDGRLRALRLRSLGPRRGAEDRREAPPLLRRCPHHVRAARGHRRPDHSVEPAITPREGEGWDLGDGTRRNPAQHAAGARRRSDQASRRRGRLGERAGRRDERAAISVRARTRTRWRGMTGQGVRRPLDTTRPPALPTARHASGTSPPRLALTPDEAAHALGVSRDTFDRHILGDLRVVRRGRCRIIPVRELERWLEREACRVP